MSHVDPRSIRMGKAIRNRRTTPKRMGTCNRWGKKVVLHTKTGWNGTVCWLGGRHGP